MKTRFETRKVVVLSTAHLDPKTDQMLTDTPLTLWPVSGGPLPHGYMIYAHEECVENPNLAQVCLWAHNNGFDYIMFDADCEPIIEGLPTYDW